MLVTQRNSLIISKHFDIWDYGNTSFYLRKDNPLLCRSLYNEEYDAVVEMMESLGFRNGWIQDMGSNKNYRSDFSKEHPFE